MSLRMGDGPPNNIPAGLDAYAGYVNDSGIGETWTTIQKLPARYHLSITTNGSVADCADVEAGAMADWTGYQVGYCSVSSANGLIAAFGRPRKLWTAHYTGIAHRCSPTCWPGLVTVADGTQWTNHGGLWDESELADSFFDYQTPPDPPEDPPMPELWADAHTVWIVYPATGYRAWVDSPAALPELARMFGPVNTKPAAVIAQFVLLPGSNYNSPAPADK